jgi:hypothetical protein
MYKLFIAALSIYWETGLWKLFAPNASMLKTAQAVGIDPLVILRSYNHKLNTEGRV